jgi:hypothetical protein
VPDPAASLSEVADGEAHVLEACGLELHLLEQLMRQALVPVALGDQPPQLLKTPGERVAGALECIEPQQRRAMVGSLAEAVPSGSGGDEREPLGDDRRELPLEPCDLCAQRAPRLALAV